MQHIIEEIFGKLGGATKIAAGTNQPVQTVHDWLAKGKPEIPPWRRPTVLKFAADQQKLTELSPEALAYLQSNERTVGKAAA
jgi:hypothetical protein